MHGQHRRLQLPAPAGSTTQPAGATYNLAAGVKTLTVDNQDGTTQVTAASEGGQIHVVQRPVGKPTADRKIAGSAATIGARCPGGIHLGDCHMDYQIQLPSGTALTVTGDAGRVILHGGLTRAQVTTDAGQVSGTGLGRGSFTVATQVGEVDLAFASASARVKVTTAEGAIDVTVPGGASYKVTPPLPSATKTSRCPTTRTRPTVSICMPMLATSPSTKADRPGRLGLATGTS
jgi:hypothetical protein